MSKFHVHQGGLRLWLGSAAAVALLSASPSAIAAEAAAATAAATSDTSTHLEEVVVTAERREQRLQDVPIAVTAVTAARLADAGIRGTEEITQITPGLNMARLRSSSSPFIRGVGTTTATAGYEPPTATYLDGIYLPAMPGGFFALNSIERVEVLKGPQGTLFGRNAVGGVVQIITKDPSHQPEADVSVTGGNYKTVGGSFYGTHGLGDNLAMDLALNYDDQGKGFGHNIVTGAQVNWSREFDARTKALLNLGDTRIVGSLDYSKIRSATGLAGGPRTGTLVDIPTAATVGTPPAGGFYDVATSINPYTMSEQFGGSLNIRHNFGDITFVSLTGFRRVRDGYNLPGWVRVNYADTVISEFNNMISQEFQLQSKSGEKLEWTVGAFGFRDHGGFDPLLATGSSQAANGGFEARYPTLHTRSYAVFGQATYNLTSTTRLTVGLRYTMDHSSIVAYNVHATTPTVQVPFQSQSWNKPTWRFAVDQKLNDAVMVYASYNRGFKAGTFNGSAPADKAVSPETLDAFEVGEKADLFDRRLRLNTSAFYYNYKDIQINALSGTPAIGHLLNAARAKIYGVELEAEYVPVDNLSLRAAVSLLHDRYEDFTNGPIDAPRFVNGVYVGGNTAGVGDDSGKRIPYSPDWTTTLSAVYTIPMASGDIGLSGSWFHSNGFTFVASNRFGQPAYNVVNTSVSWMPGNRGVKLELWAKNLTAQKYWAFGQESTVGDIVSSAPGRTFGATASYTFK